MIARGKIYLSAAFDSELLVGNGRRIYRDGVNKGRKPCVIGFPTEIRTKYFTNTR
jgi:hypothetical protein